MIFVLVIAISGCSPVDGDKVSDGMAVSPAQSDTGPDISETIAQQAKSMESVNSCRSSVYLEINLHSGTTNQADTSLTANMKSSIDMHNHLLSSVITTTIILQQAKKEMEQRIIASGENIYLKEKTQAEWQMQSLDKNFAEKLWIEQGSQVRGAKYAALMSPERLVYSGKEKSNGHDCRVFKQTLDSSQLGDITPELQQQLLNSQGLAANGLDKVIKNAEVTFLIDEQSYYLREFRVNARVSQDIQGQQVTGTIAQYHRYDAFNEPVTIQMPEIK
jgi:hypothetical protein